ncbi:ABC transporter permease [Halomarina salina]|uniref:ABC transporter permease n=1 Tax=Halomarina salina TaxID=1872699 RepID=A0ABD5RRY8_9EURY|nr:ABC transporter permease [Halomarina salina]
MSEATVDGDSTTGRDWTSGRFVVVGAVLVALVVLGVAGTLFPDSTAGALVDILLLPGTWSSTLVLAVPITLAAVGGIFAEKSGVINIGLEGLLIISAFTAIFAADITGSLWLGFGAAIAASVALALVFAVVCIEFRANQIIAGLAIWLIALGLAPFAARLVYGGPNTKSLPFSVPSVRNAGIPVVSPVFDSLAQVSLLGPFQALFRASLMVYLMFAVVALSWYVLNRTNFGMWVRASGENPKALDTSGVSVPRVRYAAAVLSGVFCGLGGAALSYNVSQFTGSGQTIVNGKGFIAIVAYLFGNYNPVGAMFSTFLFTGLEAIQQPLQFAGIGVPGTLIQTFPYIGVIVVLALVGRTRIPEAAGEHYETGEDN